MHWCPSTEIAEFYIPFPDAQRINGPTDSNDYEPLPQDCLLFFSLSYILVLENFFALYNPILTISSDQVTSLPDAAAIPTFSNLVGRAAEGSLGMGAGSNCNKNSSVAVSDIKMRS